MCLIRFGERWLFAVLVANMAVLCVVALRKLGPQGQKYDAYAHKGANMAATQYTKQQFKSQ